MSAKLINGDMQITRDNHNNINIEVQCSDSLAHFLAIKLTTDQFAMLVTGCHQSDIKMEVNHLDRVGKTRIREERQVLLDYKDYGIGQFDKDAMSKWLARNCREDGYIVNAYLGSQNSIKHVDNGALLNYSVMKFVEGDDNAR